MNMRGIHYKGMIGKSNVIKRNAEKVWGARYLPKNTVINISELSVHHLQIVCSLS
jgi:hypothetical protein